MKGKLTSFDIPEGPGHSVNLRAVVLKIGEIDTLHEKFYAEVFIEAVWTDSGLKPNFIYDPDKDWNPELYVVNCFGDVKEHIWYHQYSTEEYDAETKNVPESDDTNLKIDEFQIFEKKSKY